jgi:hypothetical protein
VAVLISAAPGNMTDAGSWALATDGSELNAYTLTTTLTSYVASQAITITNGAVITGIWVYGHRNTTSGTVTVALFDGAVALKEISMNASDVPTESTWLCFSFGGSNVTGDGGSDYCVKIKSSNTKNVSLYRTSTSGDWCRLLPSTTAVSAPTTGDSMIIVHAIVMDNTASTQFGALQIWTGGSLTWGTSASTAYLLTLGGNLIVYSSGSYICGSVENPMPSTSTATLQFVCSSHGQYGFNASYGSTVTIQGAPRTHDRCFLAADASKNDTTLTTSVPTGWLDDDYIGIASTTRTYSQCERVQLNGAASGTSITIDGGGGTGGGLAYAHSGVSSTQAEIVLLTRNVVIKSTSGYVTYVYIGSSAIVDIDWVEFAYVGDSVINAYGVQINTTTGSCSIQHCSMQKSRSYAIYVNGTTCDISNNVVYDSARGINFNNADATSITCDNTWVIYTTSSSDGGVIVHSPGTTTVTNCHVAGINGDGVYLGGSIAAGNQCLVSDNVAHSCAGYGFKLGSLGNYSFLGGVLDGCVSWRNNSDGLTVYGRCQDFAITDYTAFGNNENNLIFNNYGLVSCTVTGMVSSGDSTYDTTNGVYVNTTSAIPCLDVVFKDCDFSTVTGINTAHTKDFTFKADCLIDLTIKNSKLGAGIADYTNLHRLGVVRSLKHNQTATSQYYTNAGMISPDTETYHAASPAERLTPASASIKLESGYKQIALDSGETATVSVWVYKDATYNGNEPRLIVKTSYEGGITSDTVLDTMTAAVGNWELLGGTTPAVSADCVIEVCVDCDGTVGYICTDDWSVA